MISEWMKVMLEEISRKKAEAEAAREEEKRRETSEYRETPERRKEPPPPRSGTDRAQG
jgi:hypothetical protein